MGSGAVEERAWTGGPDPGRGQSLGLRGLGRIGFCSGRGAIRRG